MLKVLILLLIFQFLSKSNVIRALKNIAHLLNAFAACVVYRFPGKKITVIGITGTDGKTTTTHLTYEILKTAGKRVSMVSSVYGLIGGEEFDTGFHVTTPNPWFVQKSLRRAVDSGDDYFVLEVTSHGLDQNRVWGIPFAYGVLTNVTHEHLDYHKTYENYVKTKAKLLARSRVRVVNCEDESYSLITSGEKIITYGLQKGDVTFLKFPFTTPLPGEYNKLNCLAASAVAKGLGISDEIIKKALRNFTGITGRFERIDTKRGFDVIIDFAHTPNALINVLSALRAKTKGNIIHIFGCAGLRDQAKRPMMGAASAKYANITIVTEEDYRTEDIDEINKQIEKGYREELKAQNSKIKEIKLLKINNRQDAVNKAISLAKKGDVVIMTGKGHEKSLCRGKVEYPWSEHEAVRTALSSQHTHGT
jgi:UDP-N-acetylmuramoyl-L-alanyl-D-glutamate--2,6-diaminopimelate ligase